MRIFLLIFFLSISTGILSAQQIKAVGTEFSSEQSVLDKEKEPEIKIFPVPVLNSRFTITSDIPFKFVRITNIIGQEITREKLVFPVKRKEIELLGSEKGIFLVTIELEDNRKIVRKIMVDTGR
jgi:hypothetical protein